MSQQVIAHRGASAYAPENTMAAFEKAFAMGCRWVEFDVMLSADGVPFVLHDHQLKRTTSGKGHIDEVTSEDLQSLSAGKWFSKRYQDERIPTLQEVLKWLVTVDGKANIELKPSKNRIEETVTAVLAEVHRVWPRERELPLVSSFEQKALQLCRTIAPDIPIGFLMDRWQEDWQSAAEALMCYSIHVSQACLTQARVEAIKARGYQVYSYTVNRPRQACKLLKWGVDAVFSDYPDLLG